MCKAIGLYSREIGNAALSSSVSPRRRRYKHVVPWSMQLHSLAKELKHSNVFPCVTASARYRGSGEPASRRGSPVSRKAAFLQIGKAATLLLTEPLRLRHLPYPRFTHGRGDIATYPNRAQPHICQHHQPLNHKLSTLNPQP